MHLKLVKSEADGWTVRMPVALELEKLFTEVKRHLHLPELCLTTACEPIIHLK